MFYDPAKFELKPIKTVKVIPRMTAVSGVMLTRRVKCN